MKFACVATSLLSLVLAANPKDHDGRKSSAADAPHFSVSDGVELPIGLPGILEDYVRAANNHSKFITARMEEALARQMEVHLDQPGKNVRKRISGKKDGEHQ